MKMLQPASWDTGDARDLANEASIPAVASIPVMLRDAGDLTYEDG